MKHVWSIICEKSLTDIESNLLSIINCIEELRIEVDMAKAVNNEKFVLPVSFQIVSLWSIKDPSKDNINEVSVKIISPDNEVLAVFENILKSKKGDFRFRSRINIEGMPLSGSGRYYFVVTQKEGNDFKIVAELPFDVELVNKRQEDCLIK